MPRLVLLVAAVVVLVIAIVVLLPAERSEPIPVVPVVHVAAVEAQHGLASYYARALHGQKTASGVRFDTEQMVAAHPTLAFGTVVRVTNTENERSVDVTVVDRGPTPRLRREGVIIDLSRAAAKALDILHDGRAPVRVDVVTRSADLPGPSTEHR